MSLGDVRIAHACNATMPMKTKAIKTTLRMITRMRVITGSCSDGLWSLRSCFAGDSIPGGCKTNVGSL
jgi:hypothetical protein